MFPRNQYLNVQVSGAHILEAQESMEFSNFRENTFIASVLYRGQFWNDRILPELRLAYNMTTDDFFVSPRIAYDATDHITVTLGANVLEGDSQTLFGQFTHNDQIFFLFEYTL
jgi:hypothetical protein